MREIRTYNKKVFRIKIRLSAEAIFFIVSVEFVAITIGTILYLFVFPLHAAGTEAELQTVLICMSIFIKIKYFVFSLINLFARSMSTSTVSPGSLQ